MKMWRVGSVLRGAIDPPELYAEFNEEDGGWLLVGPAERDPPLTPREHCAEEIARGQRRPVRSEPTTRSCLAPPSRRRA